jgi:hypothetical protein
MKTNVKKKLKSILVNLPTRYQNNHTVKKKLKHKKVQGQIIECK